MSRGLRLIRHAHSTFANAPLQDGPLYARERSGGGARHGARAWSWLPRSPRCGHARCGTSRTRLRCRGRWQLRAPGTTLHGPSGKAQTSCPA